MVKVEGAVRVRGGRVVWLVKGTFPTVDAARAAWGHMLDSVYGADFRIVEVSA